MKTSDFRRLIHSLRLPGFGLCVLVLAFMVSMDDLQAREVETEGARGGSGGPAVGLDRQKEGNMTDTNQLTEEEGRQLLSVARKTIEAALFDRQADESPDSAASRKFFKRRGTFVTLTIEHNLRGCIGHIIPQETLIEGIKVNAINAAFRDPRFRPLSKQEWERVKIEVSVLTDPEELPYEDAKDLLEKLRPGVDGVILKKGYNQSTFLPQVWEQLPRKEEFLTHLCMKAGLDGDAWKREKIEVSTYQVQAFEE
jgi:AmmeMemoRadiSam system protein A